MKEIRQQKWDMRFLKMAKHIAHWSKDDSTKVGSVITDSSNRIVSMGFNGLPTRVFDSRQRYLDRENKLRLIIHAEENALLFARGDVSGCTCYVWPIPPCARCSAKLIQAGITRIVSCAPDMERASRWADDFTLADELYQESGMDVRLYDRSVADGPH